MKHFFTLLFVCSLFSACSGNDNTNFVPCGPSAEIITTPDFDAIDNSNYVITNVAINQDCLEIAISSSGCSGNNWEVDLFSNPQRDLKIALFNPELCAAVVTKTVSFNLIPLRIQGQNQVLLALDGWNENIEYNY